MRPDYPKLPLTRVDARRALRIAYADHLRELGALVDVTHRLEKLALHLTQIRSLEGLLGLDHLETVELFGGRVEDVAPLRSLGRLRYARLELPDLESIEPLRDHPSLRMISLNMAREPDLSVLESIPGLVAVGRGKSFEQPILLPDPSALASDDPIRLEWARALRE